jgi:hypothetical protein
VVTKCSETGFDRVDEVAVHMRVADIKTDADRTSFEAFHIVFDEVHQRSGA